MSAVDCGFLLGFNEEILLNSFDLDRNPERSGLRKKRKIYFSDSAFVTSKGWYL